MGSMVPRLSGRDVVRVFCKFVRQSSSHMILTKTGENVTLSVPDHREVAKCTLRGLIRSAGLTVEQFASAI